MTPAEQAQARAEGAVVKYEAEQSGVDGKVMAVYINRSDWERLPQDERWRRIGEGVVVRDDDWEQREIRAERVRAETAAWRREHAAPQMKLKDFQAMTHPDRNEYIRNGGTVID
jgi:hypothetical protein